VALNRSVRARAGLATDRFEKDNGNDSAGNAICGCKDPRRERAKSQLISAGQGRSGTIVLEWAGAFLFAGTAAGILLIARLFPDCWFLSLFALIPFLIKAARATALEGARLAFLLGCTFLIVLGLDRFPVDPLTTISKSAAGVAIFTVFGALLGWSRKRFRFNPAVVALLWVGIEFALIKLDVIASAFGEAEFSRRYFFGLTALFGFLIVSFLIVFVNSLLVLAVDRVVSYVRGREITVSEPSENKICIPVVCPLLSQRVNRLPSSRAPPLRPFVTAQNPAS
jgi:hypothetical protein